MGLTMETKARKLVSFAELKPTFGISYSRRHIFTIEGEGKFPRRIRIGANRVGWLEHEIEAWIDSRAEARR